MGINLFDIVEVAEAQSRRLANIYLAGGYVLLGVAPIHVPQRHKNAKGELVDGPPIRKHEYVMGRTDAVPAIDREAAIAEMRAGDPWRPSTPAPTDERVAAEVHRG